MLTPDQRKVLDILIQDHLGMSPSMMTLRDLVGLEVVQELPVGNTARVSQWIIRRAVSMPTSVLLQRLVDAVDSNEELVELVELRTYLDGVRAGTAEWEMTGIDELWVPDQSWPFIDRHDLRVVVGRAALGNAPPVLLMEGPTGFGKRTMCHYMDLVVRREGRFRPVVRHIQRDPEPGMLDSLVADLRMELGLEQEDPGGHEEPEREGTNRAATLAQDAMLASNRVYFVANVVDPNGVEPEVLRFLDAMLGRVQSSPETANNLRVILLAPDAGVLGFANLPTVEARHVFPDITEESLVEWLTAAVPGRAQALYSLSAKTVFQDIERRRQFDSLLPSQQLGWLARLSRKAHEQLDLVP